MARGLRPGTCVGVLILLLFLASHLFLSGPLFPWSPIRPGYAATEFARATVVYPERLGLPAGYEGVESILGAVERANRLHFRDRVTIMITDSWGLFNRGSLLRLSPEPLPVLGASLQTGTVIYVSPLARQEGRDLVGLLRHELTHALMFQQMPLRSTFELTRLNWFEEGLAMLFSRSIDPNYMNDREWRSLTRDAGYRLSLRDGGWLRRVPQEQRGVFWLAESRLFVEFLMRRHGHERFFRYRDRVLELPTRHVEVFRETMGEEFPEAMAAFEEAVRSGEWPR